VILNSKSLKPKKAEMFGTDEVFAPSANAGVYSYIRPSDHYGLALELSFENREVT